jgi:PPM family protein phosphatase
MAVKLFCCYAHEDEPLLNKLKSQLSPLRRQGLIEMWHDRNISAGTKWEEEIDKHLNEANLILLLISSDFMDSDYCYSIEMQRALERDQRGEVHVIPIILRPVYWQGVLGTLQALPIDAKPIVSSSWYNTDEAFFNVAEGIRKLVENPVIEAHKGIEKQAKIDQATTQQKRPTAIHLVAAYQTDVGKQREQNEDCPYSNIKSFNNGDRGLFIVADGMGSQAGEVASKLAVQKISEDLMSFFWFIDKDKQREIETEGLGVRSQAETLTPEIVIETRLKQAVRQANKAILNYQEENPSSRGLGCTITLLLVDKTIAYIANLGECRTYLLRNGTLKVLTKDHSLVYKLVEAKQIEPDDIYTHPRRNLIYRSLGARHKNVEPDIFVEILQPHDTLLLCSDGLWEMVHDKDLENVLKLEKSPQEICNTLIDQANENGGEDNITAIIVCVS